MDQIENLEQRFENEGIWKNQIMVESETHEIKQINSNFYNNSSKIKKEIKI